MTATRRRREENHNLPTPTTKCEPVFPSKAKYISIFSEIPFTTNQINAPFDFHPVKILLCYKICVEKYWKVIDIRQ